MHPHSDDRPDVHRYSRFGRRAFLAGGAALVAGYAAYPWLRRNWPAASVFIAKNQRYDGSLVATIRDGLLATGIRPETVRGKCVLLKPNLVEPTRDCPQMTTHPAMVLAAAEVFRDWGAQVKVGEGPGHVRDTEMALSESGIQEAIASERLEFADLNYEEVGWRENGGRASKLPGLYFPQSVLEAELVVSMPKMKTHHWVGFTASMKNLYGVIPGIKYGWPKNVLHHAGIPETVFDINASLPKTIAIVDGIVAMEGDGPIMGSAKPMGLVVVAQTARPWTRRSAESWNWIRRRSAICNSRRGGSGPSMNLEFRSGGRPGRASPSLSPFSKSRTCSSFAASALIALCRTVGR